LLISAKYSLGEETADGVTAQMRVTNKCSISLYDVHVLVYGVEGPGIETEPPTIFQ
jgi:hypothetical protein